jgi:capsular exopolysaccharide synthesis family protein
MPGEGKTLVATNLAVTMAVHNQRTLLVDGDLRHASAGRIFNLTGRPGIVDWWEGKSLIENTLYKSDQLPLWILPAAEHNDSDVRLLQSSDLQQLIATLSESFDWIIIDSPPLTPFADAASWTVLTDAVVLVARRGVTPQKILRRALKTIDITKVIATVFNDAEVNDEQHYYNHYYGKSR